MDIIKYRIELIKESDHVHTVGDDVLDSPKKVCEAFCKVMRLDRQAEEVVAMFCLDSKLRIVGAFEVSRGALTSTILSPREIYKRALLVNAKAIILAHNHPSGHPDPSQADIVETSRVAKAGRVIGVELLDHLVIGDREHASIREMKESIFC